MTPGSIRRQGRHAAPAVALALCAIVGGTALLEDRAGDGAPGAAPLPVPPAPGSHVMVSHDWIEASPAPTPEPATPAGGATGFAVRDPGRAGSQAPFTRCRNCLRIHLFPAVL